MYLWWEVMLTDCVRRRGTEGTRDLSLTWYLLACFILLVTCFVNPEKKKSHEWIFDDDAQSLGSRLMPVTCGLKRLARCALGLQ